MLRRAAGRAAAAARTRRWDVPARRAAAAASPLGATPRRLASSGPGAWISQLAPMARQAFSWDMSVDRERVWFSFQEEGAERLLASFRTAADSDFGGQSQCTLEVCRPRTRVRARQVRCCAAASSDAWPPMLHPAQLTEHGSAVFSGQLSLALAHQGAQLGAEEDEGGKQSPSVKQRLANWFAGERPRTAKVCPSAGPGGDRQRAQDTNACMHRHSVNTRAQRACSASWRGVCAEPRCWRMTPACCLLARYRAGSSPWPPSPTRCPLISTTSTRSLFASRPMVTYLPAQSSTRAHTRTRARAHSLTCACVDAHARKMTRPHSTCVYAQGGSIV